MKKIVSLVCVLCAVCLVGCERVSPTDSASTEVTLDGVRYSVEGAASQDLSIVNGSLTYTGGGLVMSASGGDIIVNGRKYGPVKPGDSVSVSRAGKVFVNGEEAAPR